MDLRDYSVLADSSGGQRKAAPPDEQEETFNESLGGPNPDRPRPCNVIAGCATAPLSDCNRLRSPNCRTFLGEIH